LPSFRGGECEFGDDVVFHKEKVEVFYGVGSLDPRNFCCIFPNTDAIDRGVSRRGDGLAGGADYC